MVPKIKVRSGCSEMQTCSAGIMLRRKESANADLENQQGSTGIFAPKAEKGCMSSCACLYLFLDLMKCDGPKSRGICRHRTHYGH